MFCVSMCKLCMLLFVRVCYSMCVLGSSVARVITLSSRPPPADKAVPGGVRHQLEGEDGRNTLQSWSDDTATQSLSTLGRSSSHYASSIGGADGRICNKHHSLQKPTGVNFHCISDGSFLSIVSKSLISVVTFAKLSKGLASRAALEKDTDLLCFWLVLACSSLQIQHTADGASSWSKKKFSSVKASPPK